MPTTEWFFLLLPLLVALLAIVYSIYRVRRIKRRVRREVHETRNRLVETLRLLRADADDIVSAARASHKGRRAPTKAETEAIAQLTSDLTDIDHLLETKLDDVEKETS